MVVTANQYWMELHHWAPAKAEVPMSGASSATPLIVSGKPPDVLISWTIFLSHILYHTWFKKGSAVRISHSVLTHVDPLYY